jgi:hypothetical protein
MRSCLSGTKGRRKIANVTWEKLVERLTKFGDGRQVRTHPVVGGDDRAQHSKNQSRYKIGRSSFQPVAERNQNRADVPREERNWYG